MTAQYKWVQWNRHKVVYDMVTLSCCALYILAFLAAGMFLFPSPGDISPPILLLRALASLAIVLLHVILSIGPLARFTDLVAPLLYNRRHLGVTFFFVALAHSALAILVYGGFGVRNSASAVVAGYESFASISGFPFEILGFVALLIFAIMAATSHDYWLATLSPRVWKSLHMLVYAAYVLVVMHVVLGALQSETSPLYAGLMLLGVVWIAGLHVAAGWREHSKDAAHPDEAGQWVDACGVDEIIESRARVVTLRGDERVAIYKHEGRISAVTNVCAHQGGPLGEGRIVNGCITCPWHGYQYLPESGCSPPPYTEKIRTYNVRIEGRRVMLDTRANEPGTATAPAAVLPTDSQTGEL